MLFALYAVSIAGDRNLSISTGYTMLNNFSLNASDTINASDTVTFNIVNLQKYAQNQVFTVGLEDVSGAPNVTITAYGKVTSSSAWVQIGSPITWTSDSNDGSITSTSPINYNYLKVEFIADGTTQQSKIDVFEVKTSNAFDIPANSGTFTIARATSGAVVVTTKDDDANAATTYRAGGTGALTIGASTGTTAITSSDWAIGATGAMTGIGAITADGLITGTAGATLSGAAINLNASSNFAVNVGTGTTNAAVSIGGGSNTVAVNSSDWDITTTGVVSGIGNVTSDGVVTVATDADSVLIDAGTDLHAIDVRINAASKFSVDSSGNVVTAGTIDNVAISSAAGGDKGINESITQVAGTALTGNLIGAGIVATNGTTTAPTGVIYGIEAKARAANSAGEGGDVTGRLTGVYASVDVKAKEGTTIRAFEASLDGAAGGTSTEAVAFEAFNNSSATQTNSYAFSANGGTASGHKAYTADLRLQNGETVSNATDGTVAVSGVLSANLRAATVVVNTDESETLTAAQSGAFVTFDGAGTATLPDPSAATIGVVWYLLQTADADLIVTATSADNNAFVADNVATSDAVTLTGAGHKIGSGMMVIGISATQYFVMALNAESELTPEAAD